MNVQIWSDFIIPISPNKGRKNIYKYGQIIFYALEKDLDGYQRHVWQQQTSTFLFERDNASFDTYIS